MKKKTIPAQKLKLNKEKIASLTQNYTKAFLGGGYDLPRQQQSKVKCPAQSRVDGDCTFDGTLN